VSAADVPAATVEKASREVTQHWKALAESRVEATPEEFATRLTRTALAAVYADIQAAALRDAADAWQRGEWANAPRRADRVQERIANGQHVGNWLRARADTTETGV